MATLLNRPGRIGLTPTFGKIACLTAILVAVLFAAGGVAQDIDFMFREPARKFIGHTFSLFIAVGCHPIVNGIGLNTCAFTRVSWRLARYRAKRACRLAKKWFHGPQGNEEPNRN